MTKAELIRKISNRAGVPDSEAKVFFEIFLKKSSELLSPGEAIFLKGFGHFQLRKGMIKSSDQDMENLPKDSIFLELMVYYPTTLREEEVKEEIVFNVPAAQYGKYNPIDSHFSLSIGKPIIPIKGISTQDFFIPLTGQELRKLVEDRVDKLLSNIELVKSYTKGNEILIIDTDSIKSHQLEFNWGEVPSKNISDSKLIAKSKEVLTSTKDIAEQEITWDFGEDISKEIVEQSILDVDKEETSIIEDQFDKEIEEDRTDWNFGINSIEEPPEDKPEKMEKADNSGESNAVIKKDTFEEMMAEEPDTKIEEENNIDRKFERVRSFSSYFDKDDDNVLPDPDSYKKLRKSDTVSFDDYEPDSQINNENNLLNVEGLEEALQFEKKNDLDNSVKDDINFIGDKNLLNEEEGKSLAGNTDNETISKNNMDLQNDFKDSTNDEDKKEKPRKSRIITRIEERGSYHSREGLTPVFIIALIIIIAIVIAMYFYFTHAFASSKNPDSQKLAQSKTIESSIVGRDYTLPVTNSYNKKESDSKGEKNNKVTVENGELHNEKDNATSISFNNLPSQVDTAKLHENISMEDGNYVVQVSSWKSRAIANQQVAKYLAKGYDAYAEKANVPGKGAWYRVKLKNFKSMREAEDFLLSKHK